MPYGNTTISNLLNSETIIYLYVTMSTFLIRHRYIFFLILQLIIESQWLIRYKLQTGSHRSITIVTPF